MSNYCIISFTSVVGKLFGSIGAENIRDHLRDHLDTPNLNNGFQHGFINGIKSP